MPSDDTTEAQRLIEALKANGNLAKAQQAFATQMKEKIENIINEEFDSTFELKVTIKSLNMKDWQLNVKVEVEAFDHTVDLSEDYGDDDTLGDDMLRIFKEFVTYT